jgi:hypothetical protein
MQEYQDCNRSESTTKPTNRNVVKETFGALPFTPNQSGSPHHEWVEQ